MMTLEDIKKEAEKDLTFDSVDLDKEAMRIPQLHNKYLVFMTDAKIEYRRSEAAIALLKKLKWEYYSGKMSKEELDKYKWEPFQLKILRTDMDMYLESDSDLQKAYLKLMLLKEQIDYIESIVKGIMNRHWIIRSMIDWRKFTNGVN